MGLFETPLKILDNTVEVRTGDGTDPLTGESACVIMTPPAPDVMGVIEVDERFGDAERLHYVLGAVVALVTVITKGHPLTTANMLLVALMEMGIVALEEKEITAYLLQHNVKCQQSRIIT